MTREQIIDVAMPATHRDRNREWPHRIFCGALQGYGGLSCAPLEYDEPDPAPDFDDDERDDDEVGPIDGLTVLVRAGALSRNCNLRVVLSLEDVPPS